VADLGQDAFENNPPQADLQEFARSKRALAPPAIDGGQRLIGNPDHGGKDMMDMF
jgi:hypothetical protein